MSSAVAIFTWKKRRRKNAINKPGRLKQSLERLDVLIYAYPLPIGFNLTFNKMLLIEPYKIIQFRERQSLVSQRFLSFPLHCPVPSQWPKMSIFGQTCNCTCKSTRDTRDRMQVPYTGPARPLTHQMEILMDTIVSAPYVTFLVLSQDSEREPVGWPWEPAAEVWGLLQWGVMITCVLSNTYLVCTLSEELI